MLAANKFKYIHIEMSTLIYIFFSFLSSCHFLAYRKQSSSLELDSTLTMPFLVAFPLPLHPQNHDTKLLKKSVYARENTSLLSLLFPPLLFILCFPLSQNHKQLLQRRKHMQFAWICSFSFTQASRFLAFVSPSTFSRSVAMWSSSTSTAPAVGFILWYLSLSSMLCWQPTLILQTDQYLS